MKQLLYPLLLLALIAQSDTLVNMNNVMETGTQRATTDSTASSSNVSSSSTSDKPMEPSLRLMNTSEKPTGTDHRETGHVTSSSSKDRSTDGHASTKNPRCTSAASSTQTSKGRSAADKFIRIVTSTSSAIFQTSKELFPGGAQKLKWTEQWTAAEKEKYKSCRSLCGDLSLVFTTQRYPEDDFMPVLSKLTMLADIPIEVYRETGLEVIEELAPAPLNIFVVVYYKSDKVYAAIMKPELWQCETNCVPYTQDTIDNIIYLGCIESTQPKTVLNEYLDYFLTTGVPFRVLDSKM